ncbi:MAG: lipid II flippase MurJ, partial [Acidimicrobiales bacterium]
MTVEPDRTGEETQPEPPFVESPDDPLPPMVVPQTVGDRNRAAGRMAVLTAVSRGTGFVRVVVVAAVLGTSYLGNTYQSANTIPNILFELFAAGVLQSVLVPIMVDAVDSGDR